MNNLVLQIDMDSKPSQKMIFDDIWNIIFNKGFDYILDNGLLIDFSGWSIKYEIGSNSELWIGPHPDALLMKAQAAAFDESLPDSYIIDMANISHIQLFDKIQDIISSRGFFNIFRNGFQTKLINRLYGNSKNNILYIGPKEQINETDGGRNFSIIS